MTGRLVDPDDLLDAAQVAAVLGLSNPNGVSAYRAGRKRDGSLKYPDFPVPVVDRGAGRCLFWVREEIEAWRAAHPARPGR